MTHDDIGELLGALALDALSADERRDVEAHVKDCATCTAEVAQLRLTAGDLALLVPEREPPPALRTRLMNLVEADRRQWLEQQAKQAVSVDAAQRRAGWWVRIPKLAYPIAGGLAVALVLLAVIILNQRGVTVHTYQSHGVVAQVVKGVALGGMTATVEVRSDHTTAVRFDHLPTLPKELAYELWLVPAKGAPVPISGFVAGANHTFSARYQRSAQGFSAVAVSIERAPGDRRSPSPGGIALEVLLGA